MKKTITPRTPIVLKKFSAVMDQYMARVEKANEADKDYCWCHDVWRYGDEIEADYKTIDATMAKANRLEEMQDAAIEAGRTEYAQYLNDKIDLLVFEIYAIAGNPGPQNCGIEFFIK
jgi:hypothetical protein